MNVHICADLMVTWIREIGAHRVAFLCSDNAAVMKAAREETVKATGLTHIVQIR